MSHDEPLREIDSAQFRLLVDNALDVILVTEAEPIDEPGPRIVYANKAFTRLTGYTLEEVLGKSPRMLQHRHDINHDELRRIREGLEAKRPIDSTVLNFSKDGRPYWLEMHIVPLPNAEGRITHFAAIERDVTDRVELEAQLRDQSITDPLSGLLNRNGLDAAVARAWGEGRGHCVAVIDIDNLKPINDRFGHHHGDQAIIAVSEAIRSELRSSDVAARVGGDEFVVVLRDTDIPLAHRIVDRIRRFLGQEAAGSEHLLRELSISAGIASSADAGGYADAFALADRRLLQAKSEGKGRTLSV